MRISASEFKEQLKCNHNYKIVDIIHGDRINYLGARNIKKCTKCGKEILGNRF